MTTTKNPLQCILDKLSDVQRNGNGWKARCPAHEDNHPSLTVSEASDGKVLLRCHAGCETKTILGKLGLKMRDLFRRSRATTQLPANNDIESKGCTLTEYASVKKLPDSFLRSLGLSDVTYEGKPAVRIPYRSEDGTHERIQFRRAVEKADGADDRFRWRSGDKPTLYGLDRLPKAGTKYIVLVEGASDCHTLWFHGEPVLGLPSAGTWHEEWADALKVFSIIYVVIEPDAGGEAVKKWLAKSCIRERVKIVSLGPHKDPSALHVAAPNRFKKVWQNALKTATEWTEMSDREQRVQSEAAFAQCQHLAKSRDILQQFVRVLNARGVKGEDRVAKLIFLATVSRLLDRPVSVVVKGPSSGGKSFVTEQTLAFFPNDAYYALTSMSEKALAYSDEPLQHRMLVIFELAGLSSEFGSYLLRSFLSEGRLCYETVEKTDAGMRGRKIERDGPTGLIITTTLTKLHPENETRLLTVNIHDDPEQTKAVLRSLARGNGHTGDLAPWHSLQTWLAGAEHRVVIPYAEHLAELLPPVAVRLRRDFSHVLTLIKAHAILHQKTRKQDRDGFIVATLDDYSAVRELISDLISEGVHTAVAKEVRETLLAVQMLGGKNVNTSDIARQLKLDKSAGLRRVRKAIELGFLKNFEKRKGQEAKLALTDSKLPTRDEPVLPDPSKVARLHRKRRG